MPFTLGNPAVNRTVGLCIDKAWAVVVRCKNEHGLRWRPHVLAEKFAREVSLEAIAERLVCRTCGATEGTVDIVQDVAEAQKRDIERFDAEVKAGRKW